MKNSNKILLGIILFLLAAGMYAIFTLKAGIELAIKEAIKGNEQLKKESRELESFDAIDANGRFEVYLKKGPQNIEIEAESNLLPYLETTIIGNSLKIHQSEEEVLDFNSKPKVYVSMPDLSSLKISGTSGIVMQDSFFIQEAHVNISGATKSNLHLGCEQLNLNISGIGDVAINGSTSFASIHISGSGTLSGKDFRCENANVTVNGVGDASIYVKGNLTATVAGAGSIFYYGQPASKSTRISGTGQITPR